MRVSGPNTTEVVPSDESVVSRPNQLKSGRGAKDQLVLSGPLSTGSRLSLVLKCPRPHR